MSPLPPNEGTSLRRWVEGGMPLGVSHMLIQEAPHPHPRSCQHDVGGPWPRVPPPERFPKGSFCSGHCWDNMVSHKGRHLLGREALQFTGR